MTLIRLLPGSILFASANNIPDDIIRELQENGRHFFFKFRKIRLDIAYLLHEHQASSGFLKKGN